MRTKVFNLIIVLITFFVFSSNLRSQTFAFTNSITCPVEITFEEGTYVSTPAPGGCQVCNWSTTTVQPGNTFTFSTCGADICIIIVKVDGNTINWYNHANYLGSSSTLGCHPTSGTGPWIIAQNSTGECPGGWFTSWVGTTLVIQ